jgi:hypothetical protein
VRSSIKVFIAACTGMLGCATTQPAPSDPQTPPAPAAPWSAAPVTPSQVPQHYLDVWRRAENRAQCALIAPAQLPADGAAAVPRPATFSGGWAVAYDLPQERSAFGIAGSGTDAWSPDVYDQWPNKIRWADGSSAGYGLEGNTGTNWLAYVKIPGQQCLYNVWSRRGRSHLEQLLGTLRYVK